MRCAGRQRIVRDVLQTVADGIRRRGQKLISISLEGSLDNESASNEIESSLHRHCPRLRGHPRLFLRRFSKQDADSRTSPAMTRKSGRAKNPEEGF